MKRLLVMVLLAPLLMAGQCQPQINVREACGVLQKTLYRDGKFMFTDSEIDALREVNQNKIIAVKNYYRDNCKEK